MRSEPMFERSWQSWSRAIRPISRRNQVGVRSLRRKGYGRRPSLETLEDRLVLSFVLGSTSLLEGPVGGTSSDLVIGSGDWSAKANDDWLHVSTPTGSGSA